MQQMDARYVDRPIKDRWIQADIYLIADWGYYLSQQRCADKELSY